MSRSHSWSDKEIAYLKENYAAKGARECARVLKRTYGSTQGRARDLGLNYSSKSEVDLDSNAVSLDEKKVLDVLKGHTNQSLLEVCDRLDKAPSTVLRTVESLKAKHYNININDDTQSLVLHENAPIGGSVEINVEKYFGSSREVVFGVTSDKHYGNQHCREDLVNLAYDIFKEEGVNVVFDCANMVDGEMSFNRYELVAHGIEGQTQYLIEHAPKVEGITTYFITASHHENWAPKLVGLNYGAKLESDMKKAGRNDWKYLGYIESDVSFKTKAGACVVRLSHPRSGNSYALCVDDKTEILTNEGWKLFVALNRKEKVATLNTQTNTFEWQLPTNYTEQSYAGIMYGIKARCVDLLVTPEHHLWVRRYNYRTYSGKQYKVDHLEKQHISVNYNWQFKTAEELVRTYKHKQQWQLQRGGSRWVGCLPKSGYTYKIPYLKPRLFGHYIKHIGEVSLLDLVELMSWYVTEGTTSGNLRKNAQVTICQNKAVNPENYTRIWDLMVRLNLSPKPFVMGGEECGVVFSSREMRTFLVTECGTGSYYKHLPNWVKECPPDVLERVFVVLNLGDGSHIRNNAYLYGSVSKQLATDYEEIALKLGYGVTEGYSERYKLYMVNATSGQIYPTINTKPEEVDYVGKVYCVSVPNRVILVRRNGRITWVGNSYQSQKIIESYSGGEKPHVLLLGHFHKLGYFFIRNIHTVLCGTFEDQTVFLREHHIESQLGFWIIRMTLAKDGSVLKFVPQCYPFFDRSVYQNVRDFTEESARVKEKETVKPVYIF